MTEERKFAFIGYIRDEHRFDTLQVYASDEGEAKAKIEESNIALIHGDFVGDGGRGVVYMIDAEKIIQKAADDFSERKLQNVESGYTFVNTFEPETTETETPSV